MTSSIQITIHANDIMGVPKIGTVPQNGWFIMNGKPSFQMDDLGGKPTIFGNIHIVNGW